MDLSVVVPTLNGRDALVVCLDALAEAAPAAEMIVANGPSSDGTTGMVRERDDVDVLLELADRNVNVARNAGFEAATGELVAFLDERTAVAAGWAETAVAALKDAPVATGPVRRPLPIGSETSRPERREVAGRAVTFFDGANVVFRRSAVDALDGFDEYLDVGGARDAAHRLAGLGREVAWSPDLRVRRDAEGPEPVGGDRPARKYRALAYRLAKNYGPTPAVLRRVFGTARREGWIELGDVRSGEIPLTSFLGDGVGVAGGGLGGAVDGLRARLRDRRPARNPNGVGARDDRVVQRYDRD